MMIDAEVMRFIREEIRRSMNTILNARAGDSTATTEDIDSLFPGSPTVTERPIAHPYGLASRAPRGTSSVVARVGDHTGNRVTLAHYDADRPDDLSEGEAVVYSVGKYQIRVLNDKIEVGKDGDFEAVVLGETLVTLLSAMIDAIVQHTHLGNLGAPTGPPLNASAFTALKTNSLDNNDILASDEGHYGA